MDGKGCSFATLDSILFGTLHEPDESMFTASVYALTQYTGNTKQVVRALVNVVNNTGAHDSRKTNALLGIIRLGTHAISSAPSLVAIIRNDSNTATLRGAAIAAICATKYAELDLLGELNRIAANPSESVPLRARAITALQEAGIRDGKSVNMLTDILNRTRPKSKTHEFDSLRSCAIKTLCALRPDGQSAVFASTIIIDNQESVSVKIDAINAVSCIGPAAKPAVSALVYYLVEEKSSPPLVSLVLNALRSIGPEAKDAVPALRELSTMNSLQSLNAEFEATISKLLSPR